MFIHNYTYSKQIVNIRYRMVTYYLSKQNKIYKQIINTILNVFCILADSSRSHPTSVKKL